MARNRLYPGDALRALRRELGLNQRDMAGRLGISVSYLSQLEGGERPLTAPVAEALRRRHPAVLEAIEGEAPARRLATLMEALSDPSLTPLPPEDARRLAEERPEIADRLVALRDAKRAAEERLQMMEEALVSGAGERLPWETVRDLFHEADNYFDALDHAAERLTALETGEAWSDACLEASLARHGLTVSEDPSEGAALSRLEGDVLVLSAALPRETRRFHMAHRLGARAFRDLIEELVADSPLPGEEARRLMRVGLANYAAAALLMPYETFRRAAAGVRHDIDRLCRRFGVSFEQACHRLSTLQRPGAAGIPFYFCRVDMAGNITKRHSATRLQFARFGGACPLWIVHEAVAIPDRILVQHSETPDGVRYVSMAKGLVKPAGRFTRLSRRYAVLLGCEAGNSADFVYADAADRSSPPVPIGMTCRLCPRPDCDQRAFPPADRPIAVDMDVRRIVPYRVV